MVHLHKKPQSLQCYNCNQNPKKDGEVAAHDLTMINLGLRNKQNRLREHQRRLQSAGKSGTQKGAWTDGDAGMTAPGEERVLRHTSAAGVGERKACWGQGRHSFIRAVPPALNVCIPSSF